VSVAETSDPLAASQDNISEEKGRPVDWFVESFGARYAQLYAHRSTSEAERALESLAPEPSWSGRRVLDLACGSGRHAAALRSRGAFVVAADLSGDLLRLAKAAAPDDDFLRSDMRQIPLVDDAVEHCLSMFTSFGYFEDMEAHRRLAAEIARVTTRRIVLDLPNADLLERSLVAESEREVDGLRIEERRWIETLPRRVCKTMSLRNAGGELVERYEERVMLFDRAEIEDLFAATGFSVGQCWGDYDGSEFEAETSPRLICILESGATL
jgi:SAM-dependent methyltransferase